MKILLHTCCGPCSIFPVGWLREAGHALQGFFFNPNIHPYKEFSKRLDTLAEYAADVELPLMIDKRYLLEEFLTTVMHSERLRCEVCYEMRLTETARQARLLGCDAFSTTLLVSPYQKHELIRRSGEAAGDANGIAFLYEDFRTGWQEGVRISRELEMYRQPYCGCIFSEKERYCKT